MADDEIHYWAPPEGHEWPRGLTRIPMQSTTFEPSPLPDIRAGDLVRIEIANISGLWLATESTGPGMDGMCQLMLLADPEN